MSKMYMYYGKVLNKETVERNQNVLTINKKWSELKFQLSEEEKTPLLVSIQANRQCSQAINSLFNKTGFPFTEGFLFTFS